MTHIDPQTAASTLTDIERIERRTREGIYYDAAASSYFVWGGLTTVGYLSSYFLPQFDEIIWMVIMILGMGSTLVLDVVGRRKRSIGPLGRKAVDLRPLHLQLLLVLFGYIWFFLLTGGHVGHRESATYFPTLFMFGVAAMGLWIGRFFIYSGLLVAALVLAVYLWAGPWFDLLMAAACGGMLLAVGAWFRWRSQAA
jgi:MFS family permease